MIRKIVKYPSPVLLKVAEPIPEVTDEVRQLLDDMVETMYASNGVGLAAPQIGEPVRAIVLDVGGGSLTEQEALIKMVNPEIVKAEDQIEFEEGCLSVPDLLVKVRRAGKIVVSYLDKKGARMEMRAEDLLAVAIQHEIDHLNGRLIIDNVSRLKREMYLKRRKKADGHPVAF